MNRNLVVFLDFQKSLTQTFNDSLTQDVSVDVSL